MTGLVLELQRDALNPEIKVSNLLRKALAISKKLGIIEIEDWLNKELNGYLYLIEDTPKYRVIYGKPEIKVPYSGWVSLHITGYKSNETEQLISSRTIPVPIGEIECLIENQKQTMRLLYPPFMEKILIEEIGSNFSFSLLIGKMELVGILESVRNDILTWTLELEQQGILGEGMSFSNEEKTKAQQVNYHITNNIGSMHNSQLQQDSAHAAQSLNITETNQADLKSFLEELKAIADSLPLAQEQKQELNEYIAILESQSKLAKPNSIIIKESGRTIRNLIEGAMGSTISSGLVAYFHLFNNW